MSPEYIKMSRGLFSDFKRYERRDECSEIIEQLETLLYENKGEDQMYHAILNEVIDLIAKRKEQHERIPANFERL